MRPILAVPLFLMIAAACTPARAPWTAPGASAAGVNSAWESCRQLAQTRVGGPVIDPAGASRDPFTSPTAGVDRSRASALYDSTVASCMQAQGYTRVP